MIESGFAALSHLLHAVNYSDNGGFFHEFRAFSQTQGQLFPTTVDFSGATSTSTLEAAMEKANVALVTVEGANTSGDHWLYTYNRATTVGRTEILTSS